MLSKCAYLKMISFQAATLKKSQDPAGASSVEWSLLTTALPRPLAFFTVQRIEVKDLFPCLFEDDGKFILIS